MSTNYKILIGLGVIVAGVGIYMFTRKKDETKSGVAGANVCRCGTHPTTKKCLTCTSVDIKNLNKK